MRLLVWCSSLFLAAVPDVPDAGAQSSAIWRNCREAPTRACIFTEAVQRVRDDAPARDLPRYGVWESSLYVRLSEIAEAKKDRALFADAKRLVDTRKVLQSARDKALGTIAQAEARAGFVDDAVRTIEGVSDPGPAPAVVAVALFRAGQPEEARRVIERTESASARTWGWIRLARATRDPAWLSRATESLRDIEDAYEYSSRSRDLAVAQADLGLTDRALRTTRDIGMRAYEALALTEIATLTGDGGYLARAKHRAAGLSGGPLDVEVWRSIVRAEIAFGKLDDALRTLRRPELEAQAGTLADDAGELAAAYWLKEGPKRAESVLNEVLTGYADRFWGAARYALAIGLADAGRFDSALLMAFINDEANVDWALAHIAVRQAQSRAFRDALDTADKIKDPGARSPALAKIAAKLPD